MSRMHVFASAVAMSLLASPGLIGSDTSAAVERGLDYLLRTQERRGCWRNRVGRKVHVRYLGHDAPHVGVTALAGMSLLERAAASRDSRGREYRAAARRALRYVMDAVGSDGFITAHGSRLYSHGLATRFLATANRSGLAVDAPELKTKLWWAVDLLVRTQNAEGGWRYLPGAKDSDLSVSACQLVALRAASDAGVAVPLDTLERGMEYIRRRFDSTTGAFEYQSASGAVLRTRESFTLTACGVAALCELGGRASDEVRSGFRYLQANRPDPASAATGFTYYYGYYYAIRAAQLLGGDSGARWTRAIHADLIELQREDGSWSDLVGVNYATAMATLILQEGAGPVELQADTRSNETADER